MAQQSRISKTGHQPGTPENPLHTLLTPANLITLLRLVLAFLFLFLYPYESTRLASIIILIVAASTDWLDGQIARRTHTVSVFGKRMDPVMDRVLILFALLALLLSGLLPPWIIAFLILRDVYLAIGGAILKILTGNIIDVVYVGKAATFILMTGFAMLLLNFVPVGGLGLIDTPLLPGWGSAPVSLGMWAVYLGLICSFSAACVYTGRGARALRAKRQKP